MRAVVDDKIPYIRSYLEQMADCRYIPGADITAQDVRDADVLIVRTRTRVDRTLLEGSRVQLVVTATIGFDHLDINYLRAAGIAWTNCPGCNAASVAQYIEGCMEESHRVWGIVGLGHVGTAVKNMLERKAAREGWGLTLRVSDPPLGYTDDLSDCDAITFHVPLTHGGPYPTYHMADTAFFESLKRTPLIINAARGGVVDEEALLAAMDSGRVSAAVIDTWEHEPKPNPILLQRARYATPHIAGYSANGKATATLMSLRAVAERFAPEQLAALPASPLELLRQALGTLPQQPPYTPLADSEALKADPTRFEYLRGNYPLRLE